MKPSCIRTYATLCITSDDQADLSGLVLRLAGLCASKEVENQTRYFGTHRIARYGWFLSSQHEVESLEVSTHILWILD